MQHSPEFNRARSRLAALSRGDVDDEDRRIEARRDFAAARIADYVTATLKDAPPLTDEQRIRLAELLRPVRATPRRAARKAGASA